MKLQCERCGVDEFRRIVGSTQVAIYIMTGGGWIGRTYAEQPASAYTDARVGRLNYPAWQIENCRLALVVMSEVAGMDPENLPPMPNLFSMGVF